MSSIDLSTNYMGLKLANPLVPSSSPLSRGIDSARRLEDAGASALVMYSLFEEELRNEEKMTARFLIHQTIGHGEAESFLPFDSHFQQGLDQYLEHLAALKNTLNIPVIASLNGISLNGWVENGRLLEEAGADALELNVYYLDTDLYETNMDVENRYLELLRVLRRRVDIPIAMKLSPYFSALPYFIKELENEGVDAVALFNRFYQPDIDIDNLQIIPQLHLSTSADALLAMRWIAILYGRVRLSMAATGGVHTAADVIKLLLAGADVTHLCATLLLHGPEQLTRIKAGLMAWMEQHEYASVKAMKGRLSQQFCADPESFERTNYIAVLDSYSSPPGMRR
ncbi:dihydroorotate dehydrogenase-like protein [Methylobacter luteus]|uniref:dihydroorotate dehydrogenase-like protein n=1 Tax=Methylobacter luteus TaxID=415 RepID=UPI0004266100|nr:dihydroorotate dehydrogenase-like protein [Methylobacter luteus]